MSGSNSPDQFPAIFVSGEFRRNIYLTVKEALHNIVKHAQASEVTINIGIDQQLSHRHTGQRKGFDKNNTRPFSNGLANMNHGEEI